MGKFIRNIQSSLPVKHTSTAVCLQHKLWEQVVLTLFNLATDHQQIVLPLQQLLASQQHQSKSV